MINYNGFEQIPISNNYTDKFYHTNIPIYLIRKCLNQEWSGIYNREGKLKDISKRYTKAEYISLSKYNGTDYNGDTFIVNSAYAPIYNGAKDIFKYNKNSVIFDNSKLLDSSPFTFIQCLNLLFYKEFSFEVEFDFGLINSENYISILATNKKIADTDISYVSIAAEGPNIVRITIWDNGYFNNTQIDVYNVFSIGFKYENNILYVTYKDQNGEYKIEILKDETGFVLGLFADLYQGPDDFSLNYSMSGDVEIISPILYSSYWIGGIFGEMTTFSGGLQLSDEIILMAWNGGSGFTGITLSHPDGSTMYTALLYNNGLNFIDADYSNGNLWVKFGNNITNYYEIVYCSFTNGYCYWIRGNSSSERSKLNKSYTAYAPIFVEGYYLPEGKESKIWNSIISDDIPYDNNDNCLISWNLLSGRITAIDDIVYNGASDRIDLINLIKGSTYINLDFAGVISMSGERPAIFKQDKNIYLVCPEQVLSISPVLDINNPEFACSIGECVVDNSRAIFRPNLSLSCQIGSRVTIVLYDNATKYTIDGYIESIGQNGEIYVLSSSLPGAGTYSNSQIFVSTNHSIVYVEDIPVFVESNEPMQHSGKVLLTNKKYKYVSIVDSSNYKLIFDFVNVLINGNLLNNIPTGWENNIEYHKISSIGYIKFNSTASYLAIPIVSSISDLTIEFGFKLLQAPTSSGTIMSVTSKQNNKQGVGLYVEKINNKLFLKINSETIKTIEVGKIYWIKITNSKLYINGNLECNIVYEDISTAFFGVVWGGYFFSNGLEMYIINAAIYDNKISSINWPNNFKTKYIYEPDMVCLIGGDKYVLVYGTDSNTFKSKCLIMSLSGQTLLETGDIDGLYDNFSFATDGGNDIILCRNMLSYDLYKLNITSDDDNLFKYKPFLTQPYEDFMLNYEIIDGSPLTMSELKNRLMNICSSSDVPEEQIRAIVMYAYKEYDFLLTPYIDKNTIIKTRIDSLKVPNKLEVEKLMLDFITSKYNKMSPAIANDMTKINTPSTALSILCAFVTWRYINEYNSKFLK